MRSLHPPVIIERYYPRLSATDFHTNKKTIDEIAIIPSKRLRNKVRQAGLFSPLQYGALINTLSVPPHRLPATRHTS